MYVVQQKYDKSLVMNNFKNSINDKYPFDAKNTFGDIYIPEEFDPPAPQRISQLSKSSHNVSSLAIVILDAKTISIPQLTYDGQAEDTYFWVGQGSRPSPKGTKIPDEYG